jgi:hypothetical protein
MACRIPHRLLQALLLTLPGSAIAAPFCLTSDAIPPQCIYYDAGLCQREAGHQVAECVVNTKEVRLTPSIGAYCLVTSTLASQCIYHDLDSCSKSAAPQQATCVRAAAGAGNPGGPDPFALTRPGNAGLFGTEGPAGPTGAPPADALRNPGH